MPLLTAPDACKGETGVGRGEWWSNTAGFGIFTDELGGFGRGFGIFADELGGFGRGLAIRARA